MSRFGGSSSAIIDAPAGACFALVCDTPRTPEWHEAIKGVEVLERDGNGRTSLVSTSIDALVTRVHVMLRLTYDEGRTVSMRRESGDLRDLTACWTFEDLGEGQSRVMFETEFDPGRVLSAFARGPVYNRLQALLAEQPPAGLKRALERPSC
ncbi:MAG: type II toxin-antitoxin system RatA family toxin [Solirubrobacteraceae bacterium]